VPRLTVIQNVRAAQIAQEICGADGTVVPANRAGDNPLSGSFSCRDSISPGATASRTGMLPSAGQIRQFMDKFGQPNQNKNTATRANSVDGGSGYDALAAVNIFDAAWRLINDRTETRKTRGAVELAHPLFDWREVVYLGMPPAGGNFLGQQATDIIGQEAPHEICQSIPEYGRASGAKYIPTTGRKFALPEATVPLPDLAA